MARCVALAAGKLPISHACLPAALPSVTLQLRSGLGVALQGEGSVILHLASDTFIRNRLLFKGRQ